MKSFKSEYAEFQQYHQNSSNQTLHLIGIPLFIIGVLMLTNWVGIDIGSKIKLSFAWLIILAGIVYSFMLDLKLGAITAAFFIIITFIITWIAGPAPSFGKFFIALIFTVLGAAILYYGSTLETMKMNREKMMQFLWLLPMVIVYRLLELSGLKSTLLKE